MSAPIDPAVTAAEAEVAKAEADLAAAKQEEEEATVHVALATPWHQWIPPEGPMIDFAGTDVSATVAEKLYAAAEAAGVTLRKD